MSATQGLAAASDPDLTLREQIIGALPNQQPKWLLNGSLLDLTWNVATDPPELKRDAIFVIEHGVSVGYGGENLQDPQRELDLITSQLFSYSRLEPPFSNSAITACYDTYKLHNLIRWRLRLDLQCMRSLNSDDMFVTFAEAFAKGAGQALDLGGVVARFLQGVDSGSIEVPTRQDGQYGKIVADLPKMAHYLGVPNLRSLPNEPYKAVLSMLEKRNLLLLKTQRMLKRLIDEDDDKEGRGSRSNLNGYFGIWRNLWEIRALATHDPIGYDPFSDRSALKRSYEFIAESNEGRTGTIPSAQACFLIDRALRWVFEYAPSILKTLQALQEIDGSDAQHRVRKRVAETLESLEVHGPGAPRRIHRAALVWRKAQSRTKAEEFVSFRDVAFDLLPTACAIIIATFSARRKEEIESLQVGCIERDDEQEPWLVTWIEKTLQDIDRIPIPESVVRAVEVLDQLGEHARLASGGKWLFLFRSPVWNDPVYYRLDEGLKHFASVVGVPPLEDGSFWEFTPHQFRRFFAIVYYHRFRYASLTALTAFLKHYNPEVTRRYITEAAKGALTKIREETEAAEKRHADAKAAKAPPEELAELKGYVKEVKRAAEFTKQREEDFRNGGIEAEFERLFAVATGAEQMQGPRGEWIKRELERMIEEARQKVELAPDATLNEEIAFNELLYRFVAMQKFEPVPRGHCYCGCGADRADLRRAACLAERAAVEGAEVFETATGPDYAHAKPDVCGRCPWRIEMDENRSILEKQMLVHLTQAQKLPNEHFSQAHATQARRIQQILGKCMDEARPMSIILTRRRNVR